MICMVCKATHILFIYRRIYLLKHIIFILRNIEYQFNTNHLSNIITLNEHSIMLKNLTQNKRTRVDRFQYKYEMFFTVYIQKNNFICKLRRLRV